MGNRPNLEGLRRKGRRAYGERVGGESRRARRPRHESGADVPEIENAPNVDTRKMIINISSDLTREGTAGGPASAAGWFATEELSRRQMEGKDSTQAVLTRHSNPIPAETKTPDRESEQFNHRRNSIGG